MCFPVNNNVFISLSYENVDSLVPAYGTSRISMQNSSSRGSVCFHFAVTRRWKSFTGSLSFQEVCPCSVVHLAVDRCLGAQLWRVHAPLKDAKASRNYSTLDGVASLLNYPSLPGASRRCVWSLVEIYTVFFGVAIGSRFSRGTMAHVISPACLCQHDNA